MKKTLFFMSFILLCGCRGQDGPTAEQQQVLDSARANLVFVDGGSFMMGKEGFSETTPVHKVTLSSFSMSKYETTWNEYDTYHQIKGWKPHRNEFRDLEVYGKGYPAKNMDWQQARNYCQWLGEMLDLPMDLPTEAQWEYAARSRGLDVDHGTNSGDIEGGDRDNYGTDRAVGSYPSNPLGLYDMSGGRPEWTLDWWKGYRKDSVTDPVQDSVHLSKKRVIRGFHTLVNSVYNRASRPPENSGSGVGLRCVCNLPEPVGEE